ncbi:hypothetical protein [Xylophilus sp. Leaf220]|uniref:hypothetical protein n=1 Tax=Xylophilus sp. Leaf220 TaxID=1735686 RepID=UPI0012E2C260|nr:hypothetical protein [Xylophilus sp. Leaf220]
MEAAFWSMKIEQGFIKESKLRASPWVTRLGRLRRAPQVPDPVHRPPAAHAATEPAQRRPDIAIRCRAGALHRHAGAGCGA